MDRIPLKNPQVISRNMKGETIILDPISGRYFGLNMVGCSFWDNVDEIKTLDQIADILLAEYDVEKKQLQDDLLALVQDLAGHNLITFKV